MPNANVPGEIVSFNGPLLFHADRLKIKEDILDVPVGGIIFFATNLWGGLYVIRATENSWLCIDHDFDDPVNDMSTASFLKFADDSFPWAMNT